MAPGRDQMETQMGISSHCQGTLNENPCFFMDLWGRRKEEGKGLGVKRYWVQVEKTALAKLLVEVLDKCLNNPPTQP